MERRQAEAAAFAVPEELAVEELEDEAVLPLDPDDSEAGLAEALLPVSTDDDEERESVR